MGRVLQIVRELREMGHTELVNRFRQITRAQAVREYLAAKEDKNLTIEVNLTTEEIVNRMSRANAVRIIPELLHDED